MSARVYIGIGSNIDDRLTFCQQAVHALGALNLSIVATSSLYETEPVDYLPQGWFYNAVIAVETRLSPLALLEQCQAIEWRLSKHIEIAKGPRTIDLDILFYQDQVIEKPGLTIPHPSALKRRFVLIPMVEIAPDFIPPMTDQTIKAILNRMSDNPVVKKVSEAGWANLFGALEL